MSDEKTKERQSRLTGLLIGLAVGDSLGLPAEGLSRRTIERLGWSPWRQRLLFGRGMVSDDTEHALLTARALIASGGDPKRFSRRLAWGLRLWLAALPAGVGLATGRAILKLWIGFPPRWSGVRSAGNGPAMRSPVIGGWLADHPALIAELVAISTRITHTDPRAETGALAAALAASFAVRNGPPRADDRQELLGELRAIAPQDQEWLGLLNALENHLATGDSVLAFAESLGLGRGVGGYIYHTVPVALYAWLRHADDFAAALAATLDCGGDTDTVGAIVGALAGAGLGEEGIPRAWVENIADWPKSVGLLRRTAAVLAVQPPGTAGRPPGYFFPAVLPRNLFFLAVVLAHGFLRLVPAGLRKRVTR